MRRIVTLSLSLVLAAFVGVALTGCDESPTSVQDFDIQPDLSSPTSLGIVLIGGNNAAEFEVSYQGLDGAPSAEGSGDLSVESTSSTGSPEGGGSTTFSAQYSGTPSGIVREQVLVRANGGGQEIVDSLTVTIAPFAVTTNFEPTYATIEDFDERSYSATGSATTTIVESEGVNLTRSTGISTMEISDPGDASSVVFNRQASAPNSDRFSILLRPDASTDFNLTFTFTAETSSGQQSYEYTLPVESGDQWQQFGIGFSQIGADFNPVAQRAGGNGPLVSVELSADENVTYYVDELLLATETSGQAEIEDFESPTNPYSCISQSDASDVADDSPGFTSRELDGAGCFGYNYNGLKVNLTASDFLVFRVSGASDGDLLYTFIESSDDSGGYNFNGGIDVELPAGDDWQTVRVPLGDLGENPAVLFNVGMRNVGFETRGDSPNILIDDIRFEKATN